MRDLAVLFLHLLATVARLAGPGGARSVLAESVLVKQQVLILNRSRRRSPNLRSSDRMVTGLCAFLETSVWARQKSPRRRSAESVFLEKYAKSGRVVCVDGPCTARPRSRRSQYQA